jgi:polysaccharide export outer membrane protein
MKKIFIIISIGFIFGSCIPTKDLTYFKGQPQANSKIHQFQNKIYKLQINDLLDIQIKANEEKLVALFKRETIDNSSTISSQKLYFSSYSVDNNGFIRIPYLGEINVLGYTEKEIRLKIEAELSKMFKNMDDIFVTVKLAGIRFTVLGEVNNPGTNVLFQNQVNVIEAIANAGDITQVGDRKKIRVIRTNVDGMKKFSLDLTNLDFMSNEGYYIQPNDVVYVEPLKQKSWGTGTTGTGTITTIITALSLITTSILLAKNL